METLANGCRYITNCFKQAYEEQKSLLKFCICSFHDELHRT